MNILVLFPYSLYHRKQSPVRRHAILAVQRRPDVTLKISGQGWPDWNDGLDGDRNIDRIMPDADCCWWYKWQGSRCPAITAPTTISRRWLTVETLNECHNKQAAESVDGGTGLLILHHTNDTPRVPSGGHHSRNTPIVPEMSVFATAARPWGGRDIDILLTGVQSPVDIPAQRPLADVPGGRGLGGTQNSLPPPSPVSGR